MTTEPIPQSVDDPSETMRRRLDRLNAHFLRVSEGLSTIDDRLRKIISNQLDALGLDDITNRTGK